MIMANAFGILILLFFLWKRLKEDYHFERIFNFGLVVLGGILIGYLVSYFFLKSYWFWIAVLGTLVGYMIGRFRQRLNFFESLEALVVGLLPWISLLYITDSIKHSSLVSFLAFWVTLCLVVLFFFLDSNYKKFTWYKSGRVGFAGLFVTIIYFLIRTVVALFGFSVISFLAAGEMIVSGLTTLIFMLLLYKLSKQ